jgi:hypothetical protein
MFERLGTAELREGMVSNERDEKLTRRSNLPQYCRDLEMLSASKAENADMSDQRH